MKISQAVILCGGYGKRLLPLTRNIPKPMLLINPIPGQEEFNAQNIEERKLGKLSTNIIADIKFMLSNLDDFNLQYEKELTYNTQEIILSHFKENKEKS